MKNKEKRMKNEIWKFDVKLHSFELEMPKGAKILTFQTQRHIPRIWVLIDWDVAGTAKETRKFMIQGTGMGFIDNGKYIGSVQEMDGEFIWHLFEILK